MEKEAKKVQELSEDELKKVSGGDPEAREKKLCQPGCSNISQNNCVALGKTYDPTDDCCCD